MKKIYLMALTAAFAMSVKAQTTIKIKNPGFRGENKNVAAKTGPGQLSPNQVMCTVVCNTQYTASAAQNLQFTYTATNTDLEFVDYFELTFPAGMTPTGSSDATFPTSNSGGGAEALNAAAGQVISWGANTDDLYGGIITGASGVTFNVNVTVGALTGNQTATYLASGDGYNTNGPAGDATGSVVIYPAGTAVVNMQTKLIGVITNTVTFDQALAHNCSMGMGFIASQIHNLGTNAESNIPVNYSVNGTASTATTYTGTINPGDSAIMFFPMPYNFAPQNIYNIKAWTASVGDVAKANDTTAIAISNSLPVALTNTANVYNNGVETAYEVGSVNLDWIGVGTTFGLSQANFHSGAQAYFLTLPGSGVPTGTYESYVNLPCVDVVSGDAYRISYWRKSSASGTLTVNGQTGIFSGLTQDAAGMTDVVKAYTSMTPTLLSGTNGWQKDSADFVATATETRYFAVGGKGVINGTSDQISIRLDDFKIWKVISTGVKTIAANDAISIFPNPTSGILNINAVEVNSSVEVINVIGEKVYSSTLVKGNNTLDLSSLANGAYFVKLNSNGQMTTKKVVLSK